MAAGNPKKRLRDEVTCSLCLDFFTDPVITECGHNFCEACILKCWKKPTMPTASCPHCRKPIKKKSWMPNRQLANVVDIAKQLNDQETTAKGVCESHQEPLKFFCQDDEAPICVVCERSKGHREHRVIPVKEAAEECKNKIFTSLEKKKEELLACKEKTEQQSQELLDIIDRERQRTVVAFRLFRQFLEEEEKRHLAQMEEVELEVAKKRDEEITRLLEKFSIVENIIWELEEKCERSPLELLQDVTSTVQRCEQEKFENPVAFSPALKWRIWNLWAFSPILENMTKDFKDTLRSEYQQRKETVTLDAQTAHPQLLISEDGKCLTFGDEWQNLPKNDQRFVHHQCVLGSGLFSSGIQYWEVDVAKEEGWAIGISDGRPYNEIKPLNPERGIWAIGKWDGQYRPVFPPLNSPLHLSEEPEKIRVSVNSKGRQVAFFDAGTAALLYTFSIDLCTLFCYPFFWLYKKSYLRISQ